MSNQKRDVKRAQREARQQKQAQSVVRGICVALIILAIVYLAFTFVSMS